MSTGDQDKQFDEVLGRHVRRSARDFASDDARENCPAPGILAAYHERSLSPEEMISWKEHIASCARCQEVLTQLEDTDDILVPEDSFDHQQQEVLTAQAAAPMAAVPGGEYTEEAATVSAASKMCVPSSIAISARKVAASVKMPAPGKGFRWIAPAGAIAAGLLIWAVIHENRPAQLSSSAPVEVAENRKDAAVPAAQQQAQNETAAANAVGKVQSKADNESATPSKKQTQEPPAGLSSFARQSQSLPSASSPKLAARQRSAEQSFDAAAAPTLAIRDDKTTIAAPVLQTPPMAPPVIQSAGAAPRPLSSRAAASGALQSKEKSEVDFIAAEAAKPPNSDLRDGVTLRKAMAYNSPLVTSLDLKSIWRLRVAGVIEYSSDRGATWNLQQSFVTADLTAGSAPSAKICWIVGIRGTILVTTDAGATWKKIISPLTENLGGVHATDALHATIWDILNRNTFETADGGITWKQAANE